MRTSRPGFTLVELIISLTILGLLSGSMYYAFGTQLDLWQRIVSRSEKQQIANLLLSRITRDIRSARKFLTTSTSQKLVLKVGPDTIEYSLINQKVRRKKNNYSSYLTDQDQIQSLSFAYPADKLIHIEIDGFETAVSLRN